MEYVEPVNNNLASELYDYVYTHYKNDPMYDVLTSDCRPSNWGIKDGKYIKIDYV